MNPRHVSLLARTELRRRYRSIRGNTRRVIVFLIVGLFTLLPLGLVVFGALTLGETAADGSLPVALGDVRAGAGAVVIFLGAIGAIRTVQTVAVPANADGVLTMARHSEVVASILLVETIATGGIVLVPGALAAIAFGIGTGSPVAGVALLLAVVCVVALGVSVGLAAGFVVRNALARSATLARYRTPVAVALFLGYMYVVTSREVDSTLAPIARGLGRTPLGWYADLALVGVPVGGSAGLAAGAIVVTVVVGGALAVGIDRLADLLWYVEPVETASGETESSGMGDLGGVPRPVARVVRKNWLRAWRSPIRLLYVVYPLFFVIAPASEAVRTGTFPPYLPGTIALYGAWATGAAFTLNPLGDEGDVLPVTLTSPVDGRSFVGGCCLAGVAIGLPATLLGAIAAAVLAGSQPVAIVAAAVLAVLLPVAATGMAAGVGVMFPRFEPVNVTRGRKAVIPSLFGFAVYSLGLSLAASPGVVVQVPAAREILAEPAGLSTTGIVAAGVGTTAVLALVIAAAGYDYAVRTFDDYYLE